MKLHNSLTIAGPDAALTNFDPYDFSTYLAPSSSMTQVAEYFEKVSSTPTLKYPTGIMPPGVLVITDNYIIYERPPQYQNIQIIFEQVDNINYERNSTKLYRIPIPWQLYIATYTCYEDILYPHNLRMYFMNNSIHVNGYDKTNLYLPPLPNFFANGQLCRPMYSEYEDVSRYSNDIAGIVSATYDWVWNSGTNLDLTMAPLELLLQSRYNSSKNYVLPNNVLSSLNSEVSISSYYVSPVSVNHILKHWESSSLHEISNYDWPSPAPVDRPTFEPTNNISEYLDDYLSAYDLTDYHQCDPDYGDCDCSPNYDDDHYYEHVRTSFFAPKNFHDIMKQVYSYDLREVISVPSSPDILSKYIQNFSISLAN